MTRSVSVSGTPRNYKVVSFSVSKVFQDGLHFQSETKTETERVGDGRENRKRGGDVATISTCVM